MTPGGVGDAAQAGGVTGDDGGLVADAGGDDDRVDDVGGARGGAGEADVGVVGEDVAALEDARDLVLEAAAPGLCQDRYWDEGADAGGGELAVQGQGAGSSSRPDVASRICTESDSSAIASSPSAIRPPARSAIPADLQHWRASR